MSYEVSNRIERCLPNKFTTFPTGEVIKSNFCSAATNCVVDDTLHLGKQCLGFLQHFTAMLERNPILSESPRQLSFANADSSNALGLPYVEAKSFKLFFIWKFIEGKILVPPPDSL